MAETEDDEVSWRNVMESNAEIENQISSDWKCTICRRILINAHNGPCGCRYCLKCITKHLEGSNTFCPSGLVDCMDQQLYLGRNIVIDQAVKRQISRTTVKCPEESCSFEDELRKIHDHIRICGKVSDTCPYHQIGCSNTSVARDRINEHMQTENLSHTKLLLKVIDNLHNEMGAMERDVDVIKGANQCLQDEIENKEVKIVELESMNTEHTLNENALQQRLQHDEAEVIVIRQELQDERTRIDKEIRATKKEVAAIKERQYSPWVAVAGGVLLLGLLFIPIANIYRLLENTKTKFDALESDLRKCQVKEWKYGEFEWKIEMFSEKKVDAEKRTVFQIYSEPFFTHENGYKICLSMRPNGDINVYGQYMSVFFNIMKGPFDDLLPWPMKHDVIFELVNQETSRVHLSGTVACRQSPNSSELHKPVTKRNNGFGLHKFIKLDELVNTRGLIKNDALIIKCKIKLID